MSDILFFRPKLSCEEEDEDEEGVTVESAAKQCKQKDIKYVEYLFFCL